MAPPLRKKKSYFKKKGKENRRVERWPLLPGVGRSPKIPKPEKKGGTPRWNQKNNIKVGGGAHIYDNYLKIGAGVPKEKKPCPLIERERTHGPQKGGVSHTFVYITRFPSTTKGIPALKKKKKGGLSARATTGGASHGPQGPT